MGSLAFANPIVLIALVALPAIWWLLRITPPRPVREVFPPLKILERIGRREETPATSPLWLTLLRMALAALIILALAGPVLDPAKTSLNAGGPLAVVIDNDWAAAPDWAVRVKTASMLIDEAAARDIPVSLTLTAEPGQDPIPQSAAAAMKRLNAARPRPLEADRNAAFQALETAFQDGKPGTLAYITSGVAALHDTNVDSAISALKPAAFRLYEGGAPPVAITSVRNGSGDIEVTAVRPTGEGHPSFPVEAHDGKGRVLMRDKLDFADGERVASVRLSAPIELRNDFARITIRDAEQAGGTYLLDDGFKRRRVGVLSGESRFLSQPLLSPLYYIRRALSPFVDLVEPTDTDLAKAVPEILDQKPSMIVLADIGRLPDSAYPLILDWIRKGGTLVRFAGPRLAASPKDDPLVPVELREGERSLGGALSWSQPQPLAPFPDKSPFAGLPTPDGVLIKRQVLANPSPTLADHTWASLADGTPLVTGKALDAGEIVLFHTTADTSWSNLPLSGHFVEMLRRIAQLSRTHANTPQNGTATLAPFKLLDARGALTTDIGTAKPLLLRPDSLPQPGFDNPPGLYGSEEGFSALNLFSAGRELSPLKLEPKGIAAEKSGLAGSGATELRPALLLAAFVLLLADTLAVLFMGGAFSGLTRRRSAAAATLIFCVALGTSLMPGNTRADDSRPGDAAIISALDTTHLAYVITGEPDVDRISQEGLRGLSDFLMYRTSLEPGDPRGVDIEHDELAFYPIIYWPIRASAPMPSQNAISRIDAYMRSGGTVLFDTQDQFSTLDSNAVSPNTRRLQAILADLDIPPLEPVPPTHVLTKSFYLLQNFPGRYNGSPLWVEASTDSKNDQGRPVKRDDGVSPIMITANDFAGAWAVDAQGNALMPTVPPDERQRELAFRAGVNIVMYMLTGNYKSDQVHIPALLERLGQ